MTEGKSHDQKLLDVWATGYGTGRLNTLIQYHVGMDAARAIIAVELASMIDDPGFTEDLLIQLRRVETSDPDVDMPEPVWISLHSAPDDGPTG